MKLKLLFVLAIIIASPIQASILHSKEKMEKESLNLVGEFNRNELFNKLTREHSDENQVCDLAITVNVDSNVSCNGDSDGGATVVVSGGTAPYSYQWDDSNSQNTATATGLSAGTYQVIITDANACVETANVTISEPQVLFAYNLPNNNINVTCVGGSDGQITVEVLGGTPPYSYLWDDPNAQTTATATGLSAGSYGVTVTDANGCTDSLSSITITEPGNLFIYISPINPGDNRVSCNGESDAQLKAEAVPINATYTYEWIKLSDPTTVISTNSIATGLSAGDYEVTATVASGTSGAPGCTVSTITTVTEPPVLEAFAVENDGIYCQGENSASAFAAVSGGTPPYSYQWNDANAQTTATATGLTAGTYEVTVTDVNGCLTTSQVSITEPSALEATVTINSPLICQADNNGEATVVVSGGTAPYSYEWNDSNSQSTATASGLSLGTYQVTITDASACTTTASIILNATDEEAPIVNCQDITVDLDETGNASISPEDLLITASDNCGSTSLSIDIDSFDCEDLGEALEVTLTVEDSNGNTTECTTEVTIADVSAPVITCMEEMNVLAEADDNTYIVPDFLIEEGITVTDNCGNNTVETLQTPPPGTVWGLGEQTLTFTAEDEYGNVSTCSTLITVTTDLHVDFPNRLASLKLYPIPAHEYLKIDNPQQIGLAQMIIYDLSGREVMKIKLFGDTKHKDIPIVTLKAGPYFALISTIEHQTTIQKIIKK